VRGGPRYWQSSFILAVAAQTQRHLVEGDNSLLDLATMRSLRLERHFATYEPEAGNACDQVPHTPLWIPSMCEAGGRQNGADAPEFVVVAQRPR